MKFLRSDLLSSGEWGIDVLARGCRHLARRFVAPCRFTIGSSQCQCQHADFSRYARFSSRDRPKVFGKFVAGNRVRGKRFGRGPDLPSIATFDLPICRCICNGNYVNAMVLVSFSSPFSIAAISKKLSRRSTLFALIIFRLRNWYTTCSIHGCTEPPQPSSLGGYKRS